MECTMTLLGIISPFIAIIFSFWLIPRIESRKLKAEKVAVNLNFLSEIDEYFLSLPNAIDQLYDIYKKIKCQNIDDNSFFPVFIPPKVNFLSIDNVQKIAFVDLKYDQRKAMRSIVILSQAINEKLLSLEKGKEIVDFDLLLLKTIIGEHASLFYLVAQLHHNKLNFSYGNKSNDEMRESALSSLQVTLD